MKLCRKCNTLKPLTDFGFWRRKSGRRTYSSRCMECLRIIAWSRRDVHLGSGRPGIKHGPMPPTTRAKLSEIAIRDGRGGSKLRAARLRQMSDVEAAWLGALVEGEGCVYNNYGRWTMQITNTDLELISAALRITGTGSVQSSLNLGTSFNSKKRVWRWALCAGEDVLAFALRISPYCMKARKVLGTI